MRSINQDKALTILIEKAMKTLTPELTNAEKHQEEIEAIAAVSLLQRSLRTAGMLDV